MVPLNIKCPIKIKFHKTLSISFSFISDYFLEEVIFGILIHIDAIC